VGEYKFGLNVTNAFRWTSYQVTVFVIEKNDRWTGQCNQNFEVERITNEGLILVKSPCLSANFRFQIDSNIVQTR